MGIEFPPKGSVALVLRHFSWLTEYAVDVGQKPHPWLFISGVRARQTGLWPFCYTLAVPLLLLSVYEMNCHDMSVLYRTFGAASAAIKALIPKNALKSRYDPEWHDVWVGRYRGAANEEGV
ncbi:hypothetical protein [Nonomuraea sp. NPDC050691]|uniref:hypothetical protein n=1 Tax=Nonomuraea sp. NPDC050691 TaxID=3155661 RepID=UPI0033E95294